MSGEKRKAFIPIPFNGFDTMSGFAHLKLAAHRALFKQDPQRFAVALASAQLPNGLVAEVIADRSCHICGYSLIRLTAPNGWMLETCSAHQIEHAIKNGALAKFLSQIGTQQTYNQSEERAKVLNLQNPTN
ncbi:MAG TPA: hypothetical protein V6C76_00925 [Drouetiella sp.]